MRGRKLILQILLTIEKLFKYFFYKLDILS
jgi:hypothetical protein